MLDSSSLAIITLIILALLGAGCPDDGGATGDTATAGDSTTGTITDTSAPTSGTDSTPTTNDTDTVPVGACDDPPPPPPPLEVPTFNEPVDSAETISLDLADNPCPKTFSAFLDQVPDFLNARIYRPSSGGLLPPGEFPLLIFMHGNGQLGERYAPILEPLAQRGFIVASIFGDPSTTPKGRRSRLLCLAEALLDENAGWSGVGRLNGRYAFVGHSTGGLGAFAAAVTIAHGSEILAGHDLVAAAAIAPNGIPDVDVPEFFISGPNAPGYFVLQGTRDGDTSGGAFSSYDRVLADLLGAQVLGTPRKALVWAYRVEHNEYGGHTDKACAPTMRAVALVNQYMKGFLLSEFYQDPESLALFFGIASPKITPEVSIPDFWADFAGLPQIYGTSVQKVDPPLGFETYLLDGFENGDRTKSDGGLNITLSENAFYDEVPASTGDLDNRHHANVGVFRWANGDSISWSLDLEAQTQLAGATSLTFRIGAAVSVVDQTACSEVDGALPNLSLTLSDAGDQYSLNLAPYGRMALPEAGFEVECGGQGDGCHAWDVMQTTFRVPLADFCVDNPDLFLSRIREIRLSFSGSGGFVLFDDVAIHAIPGEAMVECRCPA